MSERPWWVGGLIVCLTLLSTSRISLAETGVSYNGNQGTLALTVKDAPLKETLKVIGDAVGISMYISPALDEKLTLSFGPLPLEEAIKRVIHPYNHAIIYEQEKDSTGKTVARPVSIKIFQKSPAESTLLITEKSPPERRDQEGKDKNRKIKEKKEQKAEDRMARKEWNNQMKIWHKQVKAAQAQGKPIPPRPPKPDLKSP